MKWSDGQCSDGWDVWMCCISRRLLAVSLSTAVVAVVVVLVVVKEDDDDDGLITALLFDSCGYMRASLIFQWLEANM